MFDNITVLAQPKFVKTNFREPMETIKNFDTFNGFSDYLLSPIWQTGFNLRGHHAERLDTHD